MNANQLNETLTNVIRAHSTFAKSKKKSVRKADSKTPYSVHPIWCSVTLAHEQALSAELREWGMQVLFFHDTLEDSLMPLPKTMSDDVRKGIMDMTFANFEAEREHIWEHTPSIRLLKLYDKVSNLMDGTWMSMEKRETYIAYTQALAADAHATFGDLNIVRIARAIAC